MDIIELQKKVRVYSKDKTGNEVLVPLSRFSFSELLQKNLIHRIEIDSNDISLMNIIQISENKYGVKLDYLPQIIYGENVDSPSPLSVDVFVVKSIVFKTNKSLSLAKFFKGLSRLIKIQNFEANNIVNTAGMFSGCSNLKKIPQLDTSKVTDMNSMFFGCNSMVEAPLLNTSIVTNMNGMFSSCTNLEIIPQYITDSVLSMEGMYNNCVSLPKKIKVDNLSSCKNIANMFKGCKSIEELELTNTDNIIDYSGLCCGCSTLKKFTISNTSSGENFISMFAGCSSLQNVSEFDFSSANNSSFMFSDCCKLTSFVALNTDKLENIECMFKNCESISEFNIGNYQNIKLQTNAFLNCLNLFIDEIHLKIEELPKDTEYNKLNEVVDGGHTSDIPDNVKYLNLRNCSLQGYELEYIFSHENLKYVELPDKTIYGIEHRVHKRWYDHSHKYCYDKFLYIDPIHIKKGKFTYSVSRGRDWDDLEYTENYYEPPFDVYKYFKKYNNVRNRVYDDFIKSHGVEIDREDNLFFNSYKKNFIDKVDIYIDGNLTAEKNQTQLILLLKANKISKIVIKDNFVMLDILFGTNDIEELPMIEISKGVVSCRGLFSDLKKLKKIESILFLSDELEDLTAMFLNCESLVSVPNLEFSNVTILDYMFSGCVSFLKSPKITWISESEELISMYRIFENCKNLKSVYGIELNGRKINDISGLFYGCNSLSSYMPLNISKDLSAYSIFYDTDDYKEVEKISKQIYEIDNDLIKKMLLEGKYSSVFKKYALEYELEFQSVDELQSNDVEELGFVKGVIDGTNPKYGIFVKIPSKQKIGLIHISRLNNNQKSNISSFEKGSEILVKIIKEKTDNKLELDFY